MRVAVTVRFIDGDAQYLTHDEDFLLRLRSLQTQGINGKQLIHELLTEDWGRPLLRVEVSAPDAQQLWIPYT